MTLKDIKRSKWDQQPKFRIFISSLIFIVIFVIKMSCLHLFNAIWPSSCSFWYKGIKDGPKGTNTQMITFYFFLIFIKVWFVYCFFSPLNSIFIFPNLTYCICILFDIRWNQPKNFYKRPEEYHVILTPCTNKGTRKEHLFPIGIEKNIKRIGKVRKSSRQIPSEIGNKSHINRLVYGV